MWEIALFPVTPKKFFFPGLVNYLWQMRGYNFNVSMHKITALFFYLNIVLLLWKSKCQNEFSHRSYLCASLSEFIPHNGHFFLPPHFLFFINHFCDFHNCLMDMHALVSIWTFMYYSIYFSCPHHFIIRKQMKTLIFGVLVRTTVAGESWCPDPSWQGHIISLVERRFILPRWHTLPCFSQRCKLWLVNLKQEWKLEVLSV